MTEDEKEEEEEDEKEEEGGEGEIESIVFYGFALFCTGRYSLNSAGSSSSE
jgi:hypothetical protein